MRLLIILLSALLLGSFLWFVVMNLDATVGVTLWSKHYPAVKIHTVIFWSIVAGIAYASIIGITEGVSTRLANRRLTREVQRLEGELNFLRTEPARVPPAAETVEEPAAKKRVSEASDDERPQPPSAPVYGLDDENGDSDDDIYSGGRAV